MNAPPQARPPAPRADLWQRLEEELQEASHATGEEERRLKWAADETINELLQRLAWGTCPRGRVPQA